MQKQLDDALRAHILVVMKTIDAHGETLEMVVQVAQDTANLHGSRITIGRLYTSPRRWIWVERFDNGPARKLDDGARWEPVCTVEPRG